MIAKDIEKALGSTTRHTITTQSHLPHMGIIAMGQKVLEADMRQGKTEIPRTDRTQCTLLYRDRQKQTDEDRLPDCLIKSSKAKIKNNRLCE